MLAFTLINLLTANSVVTMLAALFGPAPLSRSHRAAKSIRCTGSLRQLSLALRFYIDHQDCYPTFGAVGPQNELRFAAAALRTAELLLGASGGAELRTRVEAERLRWTRGPAAAP